MDTFKRTPLELFSLPQHFLVPLFQRPYVWRQEEQWEPLWKDICRVVDVRMNAPHLSAKHFLGAVVLQAHEASLVRLNTWNVIDGQQRLTTLQLLADAAASVFAEAGLARLSSQLEGLTHNPAAFVLEGDGSLKLRHLNSDREAFEEVMSAEAPVDHTSLKHAESRLVQAHSYFTVVLRQWLGAPGAGQFELRAEHLTQVLLSDLQLVERTESVPWSEELIDARTEEMIDAILRIWPVPTGHTGEVVDPQAKTGDWVGLKHLLGAKLLSAGEVIVAGTGDQAHREAVITPDGLLSIDGRVFDTPSGAAKHVRGVATNGWSFWRLPDGRRLRDVRAAFSAGDVDVSTTEDGRS